jgi:hypothetical protein
VKVSEFIRKNPQSKELRERIEGVRREESRRRDLLEAFSACGSCGGHVSFVTYTDWSLCVVEEEGACSICSAKTPRRRYGLH